MLTQQETIHCHDLVPIMQNTTRVVILLKPAKKTEHLICILYPFIWRIGRYCLQHKTSEFIKSWIFMMMLTADCRAQKLYFSESWCVFQVKNVNKQKYAIFPNIFGQSPVAADEKLNTAVCWILSQLNWTYPHCNFHFRAASLASLRTYRIFAGWKHFNAHSSLPLDLSLVSFVYIIISSFVQFFIPTLLTSRAVGWLGGITLQFTQSKVRYARRTFALAWWLDFDLTSFSRS